MPRTHRRRALHLAVAGASVLALAACGGSPEPVTTPTETVTPSLDPSRSTPPEPEVPVTWPLTGVEVAEVAQRPAVAVKIENTAAARPQTGLEDADVVWETIVEFEVSRFVAVYHSTLPEEVGPIRSVRPVDLPIAAPLKGPLVFSGGQSKMLSRVANSPVQAMNNDAGAAGMYRVRARSAPHNVYGSLETFIQNADADHSAPPVEHFRFAPEAELATAVQEGTDATQLAFRLSGQSRPVWDWDSGSGRWLRTDAGAPATSADGDRLSAVNVVSVTAQHPDSGLSAQGGAVVPTYNLDEASGPALVATGGKVVEATWQKGSREEPLRLVDADGDPVLLAPGNTWVELVPQGKGSVSTG